MSVSPLKNPVLPATILAGAVFSSLTVPLAIFGSGPVDIQLNQEPVFSGTVKDLAAPYVGVIGILSIGVGVAGVAIAGWQQSSRKSGQAEAKLSNLQRKLEEKESQLQAAMLSDYRLEASGLDFFLQDETLPNTAPRATTTASRSVMTNTKAPVAKASVADGASYVQAIQPVLGAEPTQAAVQSVVSTLAAAQAFLSFTRSNGSAQASYDSRSMAQELPAANISLQELQNQLQQIMSQVETLRSSLEADVKSPAKHSQQSHYTANVQEHLHHRPVAKPQWVMQPMAS